MLKPWWTYSTAHLSASAQSSREHTPMRCTKKTWGDSWEYEAHKKWKKKRYCREKTAFNFHTKCMKMFIVSEYSVISNPLRVRGVLYTKTQRKINLSRPHSELKLSTDLGSCTDWTIKGDVDQEIPTWLSQRLPGAFFSTVMLVFDLWGLIMVLLNEMSRPSHGLHAHAKA